MKGSMKICQRVDIGNRKWPTPIMSDPLWRKLKELDLNILMHNFKPVNKVMKIQQVFSWHFPLFSSKSGNTSFPFISSRYWIRGTNNIWKIIEVIPLCYDSVHVIPVESPIDLSFMESPDRWLQPIDVQALSIIKAGSCRFPRKLSFDLFSPTTAPICYHSKKLLRVVG